jgi:hypothetical protein
MRRASISILAGLLLVLFQLPVWAAPPQQAAQYLITDPQPQAVLRGRVNIIGVAAHPQFDRYELAYTREPVTSSGWVFMMDSRSQVAQASLLAVWDTTAIPDGTYALRLRVIRRDGNYDERTVGQLIVANARPTETSTPEETPTPTITPTPRQPTPTIVIEQPALLTQTPTPRPLPTATAATTGTPGAGQNTSTISLRGIGESFLKGGVYALGIFLAVGAFFLVKAIIAWLWRLAVTRRR